MPSVEDTKSKIVELVTEINSLFQHRIVEFHQQDISRGNMAIRCHI